MVQYDYDAWGNHTVTDTSGIDLGTKNPFRYRSYFYDTETGLYFLKTRYYDPTTCRFLSPDSFQYADPETVNGLNLYAYCGNNPVNNIDPDGTTAWWEWLLLGLASAVIIGAAVVATIATGGTALVAAGIAIGGAVGGAGSVIGQGLTNGWDNLSVGGIATGMLLGGALGSLGAVAIGSAGISTGALALVGGGSINSGVAVAGAGLLSLWVWFASDHRPGDNRKQNEQLRAGIRELGYNPNNPKIKNIINQVEKYIRKYNLNLGYKDLLELLLDFLP